MGGLGSIIAGLINNGRDLPTADVSGLLNTIKNAGTDQRRIINALPDSVQKLLAQYSGSLNSAGDAYKAGITGTGNDYLAKVASLYGPNSDAANAQNIANKQQIYSTVPGTQDAIRNAMAATGGLARGSAGVALAQPYVDAAKQYGNAAAGVDAQQTARAQQATQQALATVASMNDQMFTEMFGMSKQQAQQILSSGNMALSTQLSDLINQSNNETNQTLGAEGIAVQNGYQNAVTRDAQKANMTNDIVNTGMNGISGLANPAALNAGMTADAGYGMSDYFGALNNPMSKMYATAMAGGQ